MEPPHPHPLPSHPPQSRSSRQRCHLPSAVVVLRCFAPPPARHRPSIAPPSPRHRPLIGRLLARHRPAIGPASTGYWPGNGLLLARYWPASLLTLSVEYLNGKCASSSPSRSSGADGAYPTHPMVALMVRCHHHGFTDPKYLNQ